MSGRSCQSNMGQEQRAAWLDRSQVVWKIKSSRKHDACDIYRLAHKFYFLNPLIASRHAS